MSSIRLSKVTSFYPQFLKQYYAQNPGELARSYSDQHRSLMSSGYGWSDYLKKALIPHGFETDEIVWNASPLQQAWATEHGASVTGLQIVFEQLRSHKPEVVFFQDAMVFSTQFLKELREQIPSVRLIIGWCAAPYSEAETARFRQYDLMFSCSQKHVNDFNALGIRSELFHHAFEKSRSFYRPDKPVDVMFAGSLIQGKGFHAERTDLMLSILNEGIDIQILAELASPQRELARKLMGISARALTRLGFAKYLETNTLFVKASRCQDIRLGVALNRRLRRACHTPKFASELYDVLGSSKVNLNIHAEIAGDYAANVRLFEVTGTGSCLLTDWKRNIRDLFEPDREIVTYKTRDECIEKLRWLLNHPKEREEIAQAGLARVRKDHSFEVRAQQFAEIVNRELKRS